MTCLQLAQDGLWHAISHLNSTNCFQFPEQLGADAAKKIASALPKAPKPDSPKGSEDVKMEDFDGQGTWGGESANGDAEDEEDDDEDQHQRGGPQMQQCAQQ